MSKVWESACGVWELKGKVWDLSSHQLPLNLTPVSTIPWRSHIQPSRSTRSLSVVTLLRRVKETRSLVHPQLQSSLKITNRSFRYSAPCTLNRLPSLTQITIFLCYILRLSDPFSGPVVGLIVSFGVQLSSQSSPFLQVLSSIAYTNLLARLHGYLAISGVGTSLMKFNLGSVR